MASGRSRPKWSSGCQKRIVKSLYSHDLVSLLENFAIFQRNGLFGLSLVRWTFFKGGVAVRYFRQSGAGLLTRLEKSLSWAAADSRASAFFLLLILLGIRGRTFFVLVLALVFLPSGPVRVSAGCLIVRCLVLRRFLLLPWRFLAGALLLFS